MRKTLSALLLGVVGGLVGAALMDLAIQVFLWFKGY